MPRKANKNKTKKSTNNVENNQDSQQTTDATTTNNNNTTNTTNDTTTSRTETTATPTAPEATNNTNNNNNNNSNNNNDTTAPQPTNSSTSQQTAENIEAELTEATAQQSDKSELDSVGERIPKRKPFILESPELSLEFEPLTQVQSGSKRRRLNNGEVQATGSNNNDISAILEQQTKILSGLATEIGKLKQNKSRKRSRYNETTELKLDSDTDDDSDIEMMDLMKEKRKKKALKEQLKDGFTDWTGLRIRAALKARGGLYRSHIDELLIAKGEAAQKTTTNPLLKSSTKGNLDYTTVPQILGVLQYGVDTVAANTKPAAQTAIRKALKKLRIIIKTLLRDTTYDDKAMDTTLNALQAITDEIKISTQALSNTITDICDATNAIRMNVSLNKIYNLGPDYENLAHIWTEQGKTLKLMEGIKLSSITQYNPAQVLAFVAEEKTRLRNIATRDANKQRRTKPKTKSNSKPKGICSFFKNGNCRKGKDCEWKHPTAERNTNTNTNNNN